MYRSKAGTVYFSNISLERTRTHYQIQITHWCTLTLTATRTRNTVLGEAAEVRSCPNVPTESVVPTNVAPLETLPKNIMLIVEATSSKRIIFMIIPLG